MNHKARPAPLTIKPIISYSADQIVKAFHYLFPRRAYVSMNGNDQDTNDMIDVLVRDYYYVCNDCADMYCYKHAHPDYDELRAKALHCLLCELQETAASKMQQLAPPPEVSSTGCIIA
jgi:hypothetical protein